MIGATPSAVDDGARGMLGSIMVVPTPFTDALGRALVPIPAAVDDPLATQPVVVALTEPVPILDCVPPPVQSVPADRAADWSIAPDTLGTDEFVVPTTGTCVPTPDSGDAGIWLPPPGSVVALGSTVSFGLAKTDGAMPGVTVVGAGLPTVRDQGGLDRPTRKYRNAIDGIRDRGGFGRPDLRDRRLGHPHLRGRHVATAHGVAHRRFSRPRASAATRITAATEVTSLCVRVFIESCLL